MESGIGKGSSHDGGNTRRELAVRRPEFTVIDSLLDPDLPRRVEEAKLRVATVYQGRFAPHHTPEEVYADICEDVYATSGRAITMVSVLNLGTQSEALAGTMRFTLGKVDRPEDGMASPIEAMDLVRPANGWGELFQNLGVTEEEIGEIGRLAFGRPRVALLNRPRVLKGLTEESFRLARASDVKIIFAIMPHEIVEIFHEGGLQPELISDITLQNNTIVGRLQQDYPGYWNVQGELPQLYFFPVPQSNNAS